MSRTERVFLGLDVPASARHELASQLERLVRRRMIPGRRVPIENWHITLRFVGPATDVEQDRMLAHLDEVVLGGPVKVQLAGLGAFPKVAKAAVVWIGVAIGADRLGELAVACEDAVVRAGHLADDRPFHAHMTLSRVRPPEDVSALAGSFDAEAVFTVGELSLFRSVPQHNGPMRYEIVDTVVL